MDFDLTGLAVTASVWVIPILLAVTLHEAAHGYAAWRLGDDTAKRLGRVSFNPLRHIDPFGTLLLPALMLLGSGGRFMFGYAKPVPVNFWNLNNPRRDMVLVALAGPGTNLALALAAAIGYRLLPVGDGLALHWVAANLQNAMWINVLLAVFNMIPLPPLDGGRVAVGLLPQPLAIRLARLERSGMFILLGGLFLLPLIGNQLGMDLNVFWWVVGVPAQFVMETLAGLVGIGA